MEKEPNPFSEEKAKEIMETEGLEERSKVEQDAFEAGHKKGRAELIAELEEKFTANKELSGRKLLTLDHYINGRIVEKMKYEYNEGGKVSKEFYESPYLANQSKECEYDKNGNIVKEIRKDQNDDIFQIEKFEYNTAGNIVKKIIQEASYYDDVIKEIVDNEVHESFEYEYDKNKNKIKEVKKDNKGEVIEFIKTEYEYDRNGNIIKMISKDEEGDIITDTEFKYDEQGNKVKEISGDWESEYDKKGNIIKWVTKDRDGRERFINLYVREQHDNELKETIIKHRHGKVADSEEYKYTYESRK